MLDMGAGDRICHLMLEQQAPYRQTCLSPQPWLLCCFVWNRLVLNSLCSRGWLWTLNPPISTSKSGIREINVLPCLSLFLFFKTMSHFIGSCLETQYGTQASQELTGNPCVSGLHMWITTKPKKLLMRLVYFLLSFISISISISIYLGLARAVGWGWPWTWRSSGMLWYRLVTSYLTLSDAGAQTQGLRTVDRHCTSWAVSHLCAFPMLNPQAQQLTSYARAALGLITRVQM